MKAKTVFYCTECGNETPKWQGKCSACGSWNTLVEQTVSATEKKQGRTSAVKNKAEPKKLSEFVADSEIRFKTGMSELDRVLGGGAVKGSLVLVGGAPGIGKSTLLLQICSYFCKDETVMYVTGEESERQIKLRADRLGVSGSDLYVLAETDISSIISASDRLSPEILIVDSIQTVYSDEITAAAGSVSQVKECTLRLMQYAKRTNTTVFLIGHVNKDGAIAGPKVLEHMVDCVLYFEGEQNQNYRILRAAKNRFGSTNEIGIFEMQEEGLRQVENPSEMLLSERPEDSPGTCITCVMEGSRPVLAEIQALVAPTTFNVPRRNTNGIDYNRAMMLLAVMERRTAYKVNTCDAYINVIGGLNVQETGADLAVVISLASSFKDRPVRKSCVAFGEVGLTGEVRNVSNLNQRLKECARLGFETCIVPANSVSKLVIPKGIDVIAARTIYDALKAALA